MPQAQWLYMSDKLPVTGLAIFEILATALTNLVAQI